VPLQFLNDLGLVSWGQCWGVEDSRKLRVLLEDFGEGCEASGRAVEG